ncbi:MAG: hypothetical protein AAB637_00255 [Patescibacteria group bacterium]
MNQVHKFLKKLDTKRRIVIIDILEKLQRKDFSNLDIKKLKGVSNLFRVRKGEIRIIYTIAEDSMIKILKIDFRTDTTY